MRHNVNHESSMIQSSSYETDFLELIVYFHGGAVYSFAGVTEQDYNGFVSSESTGRGFNEFIRKYEGKKMLTEVKDDDLKNDSNENLLLG